MTGLMLEPWGKTDREGGRHHLAHHCADVAAVLERLLRQPAIRSRVHAANSGALTESTASRIVAWAFLHDAGKLAPGFQTKGWPKALRSGGWASHLEEANPWFARQIAGGRLRFRLEEFDGWYDALLAHHGRPFKPLPRDLDWPVLPHYDWRAAEAQLLDALDRWFPDKGGGLPPSPRLHHLFAGLLALADWIGSDRRWFGFVPDFDPNYGNKARERAAQALSALGLDVSGWKPDRVAGFGELTGHDEPRPAQAAVGAIPGEEHLVILEAETGSGKTEAALWRFARLLAEGRVEGLYFALPTRAAAGQIQDRTRQVLQRWLGAGSPGAVLAVPGLLRVDEEEGRRLPGWEVAWEGDEDERDSGRHWAAEHATRFLAAPVAVGTVDQAMMAALSVKHAPMRAAALARSLLVVDEVHASDAYMRGILHRLLEDHLALGGHAMLMSATLGSVGRSLWLGRQIPPSLREAAAVPYPAVWTRSGLTPVVVESDKEVALEAVGTMEAVRAAALAVEAARAGGRVLVIRNTVAAAVAAWKAMAEAAPDLVLEVSGGPALHHARFAAEDRRRLDAAVEAALGKGSPDRAVIVVGTQTLEQALDIDADLLVTDLCPVDVLLQRLGRLHRHARPRPEGFERARALVLVPEGGLGRLAEPRFENGLGAWRDRDGTVNGVYVDLAGLEATRRLIEGEPLWRLPAMNRSLVEGATHPRALAAIVAELGWEDYERRVTGKRLSEASLGRLAAYAKDDPFDQSFRPFADEGAVQTRLGGEGAVLTLPSGTKGPFGAEITRLALPAYWSGGLKGDEVPDVRTEGETLVLALPDKTFLYGRSGLRRKQESH